MGEVSLQVAAADYLNCQFCNPPAQPDTESMVADLVLGNAASVRTLIRLARHPVCAALLALYVAYVGLAVVRRKKIRLRAPSSVLTLRKLYGGDGTGHAEGCET